MNKITIKINKKMSYNQPKFTSSYQPFNQQMPRQQPPPPMGQPPQQPMNQMQQPPMIKYPYVMRIPTYQEIPPMHYCPPPQYDDRRRDGNDYHRNERRDERRSYY